MSILLSDQQIEPLLKGSSAIASDVEISLLGTNVSPVKGSSLDLSIGDIFVPGTAKHELGGVENPRSVHSLDQGHTAVIRTKEILRLPSDVCAIAFPPARISQTGLLTTNAGHVDPGYAGPLHLTVINMGRVPFPLKKGDRVIRLILFKLDSVVQTKGPPSAGITPELLDRLSLDFLDVDQRAADAAEAAVNKANIANDIRTTQTTLWTSIGSGVVALLIGATTLYTAAATRDTEIKKEIAELKSQIARLDERSGRSDALNSIGDRVKKIESLLGTSPATAPMTNQPNSSNSQSK